MAQFTAAHRDGLRGKVVLVDFCTYTCANWLRTLPSLRAWDAKYRQHGLVVIGAHTPEFAFEHIWTTCVAPSRRCKSSTDRRGQRLRHLEWFSNQYWPALYLIDAKSAVRFTHFGEGAYDESERAIQKVLGEAGASGFSRELVTVAAPGIEAAATGTTSALQRPISAPSRRELRTQRARLRLNEWTVGATGLWEQGGRPEAADGRIAIAFTLAMSIS